MLDSRSLLVLHVKHSSVSMSIPDSLTIPSPILPAFHLFFSVLLSSRGRTRMNASGFIFPMKANCFPSLTVKIQCLMDFPGGPAVTTSASLVAQTVKRLSAMGRDLGSIPGSRRSPGEGNGNPLQYLCLENPMDGGA